MTCGTGELHVSVSEHESAVICSAHGTWNDRSQAQAEAQLTGAMKSVADWVVKSGGFIGHIKSSLDVSARKTFSITNEELMTTHVGHSVTIELAAIVFGVQPPKLEAEILRAFTED